MWRCLHPLFHPAFIGHQLYSKHCRNCWEHKNESARVHPVNELSAEEALPTDQTVADFFCARVCACVHPCVRVHVPLHVCACVCTCVFSGLIMSILVAFFSMQIYPREKDFCEVKIPSNPPTTPSHREEAVLENIRYLYFEAMETLV